MIVLVSDRLIAHLETAFPDQLPTDKIGIEELRELQGQQKVIAYIKSLKDQQDEEVYR